MKSKNIITASIVLGIVGLATFGIRKVYIFYNSFDSIVEVKETPENINNDKAYTEEELFMQMLSNPRAGDIYLIREAVDSFSFFQIGNVDDSDLIPILKGAYTLQDSFIVLSELEEMEKSFPNFFDTSDFHTLSRKEIRKMNDEEKIQQIYRTYGKLKNVRPSNDNRFIFLIAFFNFLLFLAFITLAYLGIWLANFGKNSFRRKKFVNKITILILIAFLVALVGLAFNFGIKTGPNLLFRFIRNLSSVFMFFAAYSLLNLFLEKRFSFLKYQVLLAGGLILSGVFIEIIHQFLLVLYKEGSIETNIFSLFDYEDNSTVLIDFFSMVYFSIANFIYNINAHQKKLTLNQKEFEITRLSELKSKAELEALTAKTNPHFLYNSLNTIAALAKIDADKTEKMAMALSKFLKYSTNRQGTNRVPLKAEIEMVETYLKVEKIRFEDQLDYEIVVEETIENAQVPRFLLQPLVENALKHGYQDAYQKIFITIEAQLVEKGIVIKIKDSGQLFPEDFTGGYGLDSVSKKLYLLFPNRHRLELLNQPEKMVKITIW